MESGCQETTKELGESRMIKGIKPIGSVWKDITR